MENKKNNVKINVKAIIFDLGNTLALYHGDQTKDLFDGHKAIIDKLTEYIQISDINYWVQKFHQEIDQRFTKRLITWVETPLDEIIFEFVQTNFKVDLSYKNLTELVESYFSTTEPNWKPAPQLIQTLQYLKSKNIKMGILSNACSDQNVQNMVDNLNIRNYFEYVYSSCSIRQRKPHQNTFEQAILNWNIPKNEIWMIGDTLSQDIEGASSFGLSTIWISHGEKGTNQLATPTLTLNHLHELISII